MKTVRSSGLSLKRKIFPVSQRKTTEEWLEEVIRRQGIRFRYFLTLSFNKAQTSLINQYLENKHIKNVILDFFYPNKKPKDRIRLWFFVEKHATGCLHTHILMEGVSGLDWLQKNNRKITIRKTTLMSTLSSELSIEDVMIEALTNHLQSYIKRLGTGSQSIDTRTVGDIQKRVQYMNKSLNSLDFDKWDHIDFEYSDLQTNEENARERTKTPKGQKY